MRCLHFDCSAGISGDMTLAALVDLGVPPEELCAGLKKLIPESGADGWSLRWEESESCGIRGLRTIVNIDDDNIEYGEEHNSHEHNHSHEHTHSHEHNSGHEHTHSHEHNHNHPHRHWSDIKNLIENSALNDNVKQTAIKIFTSIAKAEAEVHGVKVEDVAFHEVGALDSIIDITGTAICLDILKPDYITAGEIELGGGTVKCAHGVLPVPAPATLLLCRGLPVKTGGFPAEMTTPTGAAILASCVDEFVQQAAFTEIKTGYGIGSRKFDRPNILRASLREFTPEQSGRFNHRDNSNNHQYNNHQYNHQYIEEELVMLKANIDDMTGEGFSFLSDALIEGGALDVTITPCVMKKGRPAQVVSALCSKEKSAPLAEIFFLKSTTIGIRVVPVKRLSLPREITKTVVESETVQTKTVFLDGKPLRSKIEYADRARLANSKNRLLDKF